MKKIRKFKLKSYSRSSGKLMPINFDNKFPIKVKRIFFISGKKNKIRGEHAHKKCSQFFIPIHGKIILNIKTPNTIKKIMLKELLKFDEVFVCNSIFGIWPVIKISKKKFSFGEKTKEIINFLSYKMT